MIGNNMKKLSLNETWEQCLAMWKAISERIGTADEATVPVMKIQWLNRNDPDADLSQHCYFCDYDEPNSEDTGEICETCPGALVDSSFLCGDEAFYWKKEPRLFYAELKRLNKIRLAKKK